MTKRQKRLIGFLVFLVLIQFVRPSKVNKPVDIQQDFIAAANVPSDIAPVLKKSCYDCHSNTPTYPWYFNISPVNWYLNNHIKGGLKKLNFSEWATLEAKEKNHKLEEICEVLVEGEMPLKSYTIMHAGTKVEDKMKKRICEWIEGK